MADNEADEEPASLNTTHLRLKPRQIEKVFTDCAIDLHRILVLDGIHMLPDGFRIRSHDLHGPLPELLFQNSGDTFRDKELLGYQVRKLTAIVRMRDKVKERPDTLT